MKRKTDIEEMFKTHYCALCMYSTHIVGSIDVAEDVVMDAFVRLYEKVKNGEAILFTKSYLFQMVRNASIDYCKKNNMVIRVDDTADVIDDDDWQEQSEREARLWKEIDKLPDGCRKVFLMSKCDGLKNREIADLLNISIKTVEAHISKAYTMLRGKAREIYLMFF